MRTTAKNPPGRSEREHLRLQQQTKAMNEQLVLSSVRQHELTDAAEKVNAELQTEIAERKRVEETLRTSEERFRALFELGPVAVYSCDVSGVIREFNRRAVELWGREPAAGDTDEQFCGSFKLFRPDGSFMPHAQCPMSEVVTGKIPAVHEAEVLIERPDGSRVTVVVNIRPLKDEHGEITGAINCFYDITERKQAEKALRQSEAQLLAELAATTRLQETSTFLIQGGEFGALYQQIIGAAVTLMHSDMGSLQMLHADRGELQLLAWKGFALESAAFWEWVRPGAACSCGAALRTRERVIVPDVETCDFMTGTADLDAYRKSGIRAVQSTPLTSRSGSIVGMISTHWRKPHQPAEHELRLFDVLARQAADLIERKRGEEALSQAKAQLADRAVQLELLVTERTEKLTTAHAQLLAEARQRKRLEGEVSQAVENEQLRLGQELHDGLAQELTAASVMLYTVESKLVKRSPIQLHELRKVRLMLSETANKARNLATGFYPVDLVERGLVVALQGLARRTQESFGISCVVETDGQFPARLEDDRAIQLFRILQEALHNAVKHSRAEHIVIRVAAHDGSWLLTVKDDGIGLSPARRRAGGIGTNIMHYRAGLMGGTLEIRNANDGGVIVSCTVPRPSAKGKQRIMRATKRIPLLRPEGKRARLQKRTTA